MSQTVLYGYWRSTAAYRVRIALNLKNTPYQQSTVNLREGAQRSADYLAIAPHGLVPALQVGSDIVIESPAILEWIESRWPKPALLPSDLEQRAVVRAMAALIGCDIHPLNNLRVLTALRGEFGASEDQIKAWATRWICDGFTALEYLVKTHGGKYAFGDQPTVADCYLVPQLYSAKRFGVNCSAFPRIMAAAAAAEELPAVATAHPNQQPDADR
jgi:maleylpyruvate isomerase